MTDLFRRRRAQVLILAVAVGSLAIGLVAVALHPSPSKPSSGNTAQIQHLKDEISANQRHIADNNGSITRDQSEIGRLQASTTVPRATTASTAQVAPPVVIVEPPATSPPTSPPTTAPAMPAPTAPPTTRAPSPPTTTPLVCVAGLCVP